MRKLTMVISAAALAAVPVSAAQANSAQRAARQACRTERQQIGGRAFHAKYGSPGAMRNCIAAHGGAPTSGNQNDGQDHRGHHGHHSDRHSHHNGDRHNSRHGARNGDRGHHNGDHGHGKKD